MRECTEIEPSSGYLFKALHACSGRGLRRGDETGVSDWVQKRIAADGAVVAEPLLERVVDFSAQYELSPESVAFLGLARVDNDASGQFRGIRVAPNWSRTMPEEVVAFLYRDAQVMDWYREKIPSVLRDLLPGYVGPVGVDAMVYRKQNGGLGLRHVVEINVRFTMGRVALELLRRFPN